MCLSFSDMVLSFVSALCLFLMIEAPFRKVFKQLIMPSRTHHPKTATVAGTEQMMNNNSSTVGNNNYEDSKL